MCKISRLRGGKKLVESLQKLDHFNQFFGWRWDHATTIRGREVGIVAIFDFWSRLWLWPVFWVSLELHLTLISTKMSGSTNNQTEDVIKFLDYHIVWIVETLVEWAFTLPFIATSCRIRLNSSCSWWLEVIFLSQTSRLPMTKCKFFLWRWSSTFQNYKSFDYLPKRSDLKLRDNLSLQ